MNDCGNTLGLSQNMQIWQIMYIYIKDDDGIKDSNVLESYKIRCADCSRQ